MTITSLKPLTQKELNKIRDILKQSKCPNESLTKTFDRFTGLVGERIFFDNAQDTNSQLNADKIFVNVI
ncbi:MAG: hypothetical protein IJS69_04955 [Selenomonadaceae bacterium]|nr:hypothetical protein [Selenomonadaceae bacterium]